MKKERQQCHTKFSLSSLMLSKAVWYGSLMFCSTYAAVCRWGWWTGIWLWVIGGFLGLLCCGGLGGIKLVSSSSTRSRRGLLSAIVGWNWATIYCATWYVSCASLFKYFSCAASSNAHAHAQNFDAVRLLRNNLRFVDSNTPHTLYAHFLAPKTAIRFFCKHIVSNILH